jgi:ribosomal protein S18 acetylase RimI-like enzyme
MVFINIVFTNPIRKPDLAQDIRERKKEYQEMPESKFSKTEHYQDPLHHYSVATSLGSAQEWKDSAGKMKCYMAYNNKAGHKTKIGFVHFIEQTVEERPVVYIAQAGVQNRGMGIGRRLMECVLAHYPAGTEFYILTRIFNTDAKNLYQEKFKFTRIEDSEVCQLNYDSRRYCGFKHTTTAAEILLIKDNQIISAANTKSITSSGRASLSERKDLSGSLFSMPKVPTELQTIPDDFKPHLTIHN